VGLGLYRSSTAWRTEGEVERGQVITVWLQVGILVAGTSYYVDQLLIRNLGAALETLAVRPPPADMTNVVRLENTGILAGSARNMVHFCENRQPWNWPGAYDVALADNVVGLGALGLTVFATTKGWPAVISRDQYCEPRAPIQVLEVRAAPPDIACHHARSCVVTPYGMVYASPDGLVLLRPDGGFSIITAGWHDRDSWARLRPETARMAWWRGRVVCATDAVTMMLEIDAKGEGDAEAGVLTTTTVSPIDMQVTPQGELAMLEDSEVRIFDRGLSPMRWTWTSRPLDLAGATSFNTIRVDPGDVLATVRNADGRDGWTGRVPGGKATRIGRFGRAKRVVVSLSGTSDVDRLELGTSVGTLDAGV
jgi:hypothetical protein